jgi:hypothetical protein
MEYLANLGSFCVKMDDGFEDKDSAFYGKVSDQSDSYMVRLPLFTNKFKQQFCLYKLHGSIDFYWFQDGDRLDLIKLKRPISRRKIFKEVMKNGKLQYVSHPADYFPDFLSGTTSKNERYRGKYYSTVLNHFKKNLKSSNTLIVIGYGFCDSRINQYLEDYFITDKSKAMFVVDIKAPSTDLHKRNNVHLVNDGVTKMNIGFILDHMKP